MFYEKVMAALGAEVETRNLERKLAITFAAVGLLINWLWNQSVYGFRQRGGHRAETP